MCRVNFNQIVERNIIQILNLRFKNENDFRNYLILASISFMSMYKKMRDTSSPVLISLEIQQLANVISHSKISFKQRQNT